MKKVLKILVVLSLAFSFACANILSRLPHTPDGKVDVVTLLVWAQDGVNDGCTKEWLSPAQCTLATDAVNIATAKAKNNPNDVYAAVFKSLNDSIALWPVASRGRLYDFFAWLIDILHQLTGQPIPPPPQA